MAEKQVFTVERLDASGRGVGVDSAGAREAVPGLLPGERAARPEDGAPWVPLEPGPDRTTPPCPHAAECGGCLLQHASPGFLAAWKRERIVDALARVGIDARVEETVVSPPHSRRRVKLAARRGKKGVTLGYHGVRSAVIAPIESCHVMRHELVAALPALRDLASLAAPRARPIAIAAEITESGLDVAVTEAKSLDLALTERAASWAEAADAARLTWNGETLATRRPPWRRCGRALVAPPPGAFAQATLEGEAALTSRALAALEGAGRVADLFAGVGAFTLPLAERSEVLAVEGEAALTAALEAAWRATSGLKAVRAVRRDLFRRPLRPEELSGLDGVVLDPPRQGAEAQVRHLAEAPARLERLVGVSCEPRSFARDAGLLAAGGWRLRRVTPVDQFLWSPHVELVGVFER